MREEKATGEEEASINELIEVFRKYDARNREAIDSAMEKLAEIGSPAAEALVGAIEGEDDRVQMYIQDTLQMMGSSALGPVIRGLEDEVWEVREACAIVLGKIGDERALEPLAAALGDRESNVRFRAAEALEKLEWDPGTREERLSFLIAAEKWEDLRKREDDPVGILVDGLKDERPGIRQAAARGLGEMGGRRGVEPLIDALEDGFWEVRWFAASSLGKLGDERAVAPLLKTVDDANENEVVRGTSAGALGKIGGHRAVEKLLSALASENDYLRAGAAHGLGYSRDVRALEPLLALVKEGNYGVRQAAVEGLGELGDDRAVEALIEVLAHDESPHIRGSAARALGKIGDARAVQPLIKALGHGHPQVVYDGLEALGRIGDERAIEAIRDLAKDKQEWKRKAAMEALEKVQQEQGERSNPASYLK